MMLFLLLSVILLHSTHAAKILGFFPYKSLSHNAVFLPLMEQLAQRGHQVTVVSYSPRTTELVNYTDIPIILPEIERPSFLHIEHYDTNTGFGLNNLENIWYITQYINNQFEELLQLPKIKDLFNENFDVIITEMFTTDIFYAFFYRLNAPIIGFASCELYPWHDYDMSNPVEATYLLHSASSLENPMSLWDKMVNIFESWATIFLYNTLIRSNIQSTAEKSLGHLPKLNEIVGNTSILFVNSHFSIFGAKPRAPNIIEVGGIHIAPPKPLPQNIQTEIDNSIHGVILFSLGSTLDSKSFYKERKDAFIKVFSNLKQTVLWKIPHNVILPNINNIITSTWFPQRDLLAHPKVKIFISQCGILSIIEAMYLGVPVICIPIFADQHYNGKTLEFNKAGMVLEYRNITESSLKEAIDKVLTNKMYKENAVRISTILNDRPVSPMETAIYWVEYVIRYKGASHIKSLAKDLTWYQYHNLDIILIMIIIIFVLITLLMWIIKLFNKCIKMISRGKLKIS